MARAWGLCRVALLWDHCPERCRRSPEAVARIAFVCAMPMELRPLAKLLALRKEGAEGETFHTGTLGTHSVFAKVTGMGPKLAGQNALSLIEATTPDHLVVFGIAGALDEETRIGHVVQPELVVDASTGAERRPMHLGDRPPAGKMWTTDEVITDLEVLHELRRRQVVALEMETAAIAEICDKREIPWSVFRAISDHATSAMLDSAVFSLLNADGTTNWPSVARFAVRHPRRIPRVTRFAVDANLAARKAAEAAVAACEKL